MSYFINHNGVFLPADQPVIKADNRGFRYGDGLFESIRIANYSVQFLKEHLQRLFKGMQVLKMKNNILFTETFFEHAILELAHKNGITSDGRVGLSVYRNEGGFYAPNDNSVSYLIEAIPLEEKNYVLNTKGFTIDLFTEFKKPQSPLS